jgi:hypothetical protein
VSFDVGFSVILSILSRSIYNTIQWLANLPLLMYMHSRMHCQPKPKLVFGFIGVGLSRGSSRGKGFRSWRGKGDEGNSHCVKGVSRS